MKKPLSYYQKLRKYKCDPDSARITLILLASSDSLVEEFHAISRNSE